jgi:ATPase family associated with various cellular activities (AAA)
MSLLKTAVKAKISLIAAHTDDPRGFGRVVEQITGRLVTAVKLVSLKPGVKPFISQALNKKQLGIMESTDDIDWKATVSWLEENESVLIVVNPEVIDHRMLDVGFVSVPVQLIAEYVTEHTDEETAPFVSALSGLSLNNIDRISRMAQAEYGEFTPKSIRAMRKQFFQTVRGIEEVASEQLFYQPPLRLSEWLNLEGQLFKIGTQPILTPRGFLFTGAPGTGKTSGAKYLANRLKVPLYRMDIGSMLSKWMGESDERMKTALKQVESFEPCVLIMDEVEKLFESGTGSDVVPRLLGYLLWWLQEHQSKVLVVMTTNHKEKLPPELYREGRIDEVVEFTGLKGLTDILSFVKELAKKLHSVYHLKEKDIQALVDGMTDLADGGYLPQAKITERLLRLIKVKIVQKTQE